jgi:hypothetical protein
LKKCIASTQKSARQNNQRCFEPNVFTGIC